MHELRKYCYLCTVNATIFVKTSINNKNEKDYEKYEDCGHRSLRRHGDGRM